MIYRRTQTTKQKQENYEQNENIKKETILKKELNKFWTANTITEFKNSLERFTSQLDQAKERIRTLKDKSFETTEFEEQKEERMRKNEESHRNL